MRCKKSVLRVISVVLVLLILPNTVSAYALCGFHWDSYVIRYYYDSSCTSRARTYLNIAVNAWNSRIQLELLAGTSSNHHVRCAETEEVNAIWDGAVYYNADGELFYEMTLYLNNGKFDTWNDNGALQSVAVHEFGHVIGLSESSGRKIMNPKTWGSNSRYEQYGIVLPVSDDIEGADFIYSIV